MKARNFFSKILAVSLIACKGESNNGNGSARYSKPEVQISTEYTSSTGTLRLLTGRALRSGGEDALLRSLLDGGASPDGPSLVKFFEEVAARNPLLAASLLISELNRLTQLSSFREVVKVVFWSMDENLLGLVYPELLANSTLSKSDKDSVFSLHLIRLSQLGSKDLKNYLQSSDRSFQGNVSELGELVKNLQLETASDFKLVLEARSLNARRIALLGVLGEGCAQTGNSPRTVFELVKPGPEDAKYFLEAWMDTQGLRITKAAEFSKVIEAISSLPSNEQNKFMSSWLPAYLDPMPYAEAAAIIQSDSLSVENMGAAMRAMSSSVTPRELVELSLTVEDVGKREAAVQSAFRSWVRLDNMAASSVAHNLVGRDRDVAYVEIASQMRRSGDLKAAKAFIDAIKDDDLRSKAEVAHKSLSR